MNAKIYFPLIRDEDGYPPVDGEWLWADETSAGQYKIDNIPFFVRSIAVGDVVAAEQNASGVLQYQKTLSYSGHSTLRVLVFNEQEVANVRSALASTGCASELSHIPKLIAVDIPANVNFDTVRGMLAQGEERGEWEVEEGCLGHKS